MGAGTNVINANTIHVGLGKGNGSIGFDAGDTTGSVVIRGSAGGSSTANITLGANTVVGTAAIIQGTLDLAGHDSDVLVGTLTMARRTQGGTGGVTGTLNFDMGTFVVDSINMANRSSGNAAATATINIGGGTFTVNNGFALATQTGGGPANGILNITGGAVSIGGDVTDGGGNTTTTITLDGGSLDMTGNSIGGATPINVLNFRSGNLQNVAEINNGANITKTTAGLLSVNGTNTYTGSTAVADGTLQVDGTITVSDVSVSGTSTLSGSGVVGGTVTVAAGGIVTPGPGVEDLSIGGGSSLTATSVLELDLQGATTPGTDYDQLVVTGAVDLGGATLAATIGGGYVAAPGDSLTIVSTIGGVTGTFAGLPQGAAFFISGQPFVIDYTANGGNDVVLTFNTAITIDADVEGNNLDNVINVSVNAGNLVVTVDGNTAVNTPLGDVTTLTINGQTGNDVLTIDYAGGSPFPTGGIFYNGDANVPTDSINPPGDTVIVTGGTFGTVTHNHATADSGTLALGGDLLTYTTLENAVDLTGSTVADIAFNLPAGADTSVLSTPSAGVNQFDAATIIGTLFANPSASATINTSGTDSVELAGVAAGFNADLEVVGDADDTLSVDWWRECRRRHGYHGSRVAVDQLRRWWFLDHDR